MQVRLNERLRFNPDGFSREMWEFEPGEQEVPDVVGEFILANPSLGEVVQDKPKRGKRASKPSGGVEQAIDFEEADTGDEVEGD